jgi:hypothetical protein
MWEFSNPVLDGRRELVGRATEPKKAKHPRLHKRRYAKHDQRQGLLERDESACRYCGKLVSNRTANMDHVNPWNLGGRTNSKNLVTCCRECNTKKGNKTSWTPKPIGYYTQDMMLGQPAEPEPAKHVQPYINRDYLTVPEYQTPCKHKQSPNCLRQRCLQERKIPYTLE